MPKKNKKKVSKKRESIFNYDKEVRNLTPKELDKIKDYIKKAIKNNE